jgi:hypothetical protein
MVQEVEKLCPELHDEPLAWFEGLGNRCIDIVKPGSRDGVSSQLPKVPAGLAKAQGSYQCW